MPKKNGKSELAAGAGLYLTFGDQEYGGEIYGCATDKQQASIVFDIAVDMVDKCPALRKRCKPILSRRRLVCEPLRSFYQVLSSEAFSKHGFNVHGCIFDELHAQQSRELFDVMTKGSGDARRQPLFFIITTAGDDADRQSVGWEVHQKAKDVLSGNKRIPNFYATIFGLNEDDDWQDEENWKKVNPSINKIFTFEKLKAAFDECASEEEKRKFRILRLNQWVKTKSAKWVSLEIWDKNAGIVVPEKLKHRRCYGGLDLSSKMDLTAFVLIFPPADEGGKYEVLPFFWIPEDGLNERVKRDRVSYDKWLQAGQIFATPGNAIDYRYIQKTIIGLRDQFEISVIGFDPWNAQQTATELMDAGLTMVEIRQGYKSMSPPMKDLEALLHAGRINHGNHPVLRWNFGNLEVKIDENDNIRPIKGKATDRIDGIVAMINAMALVITQENMPPNAYENRGILVV